MGCDIHMNVEILKDDKWQYHDWQKEFQTGEFYSDGDPKMDYKKIFEHPLYVGRNYNLFSVLANVRNGYGFAGVPTGEGFDPISLPRGLPSDVSKEIVEKSDSWNGDGHSHSWLTLDELLSYDWDDKTVVQYGVVDPTQYIKFKTSGQPSSWCGRVGGIRVKNISNSDMDSLTIGEAANLETGYYTAVNWQNTYRNAIGEHWFGVMESLSKLGATDCVRVVFWFDN